MVNSVGFTAYATGQAEFGIGEPILFPHITTNHGSAYDNTESVFYCPTRGLYLFTVSVHSSNDMAMDAIITLNDVDISTAYSEISDHDHATNAVIVECNAGDRVQVKCGPYYNCGYQDDLNGTIEFALNSFSGFLISIIL